MNNCSFSGKDLTDVVLGHEIEGVIEEFGSDTDPEKHDLKVGDTVILYPWIGCGKCDVCLLGRSNECDDNPANYYNYGIGPVHKGGYASHVLAHNLDILIKVPESLPQEVACMLPCSGLTAFSALKKVVSFIDDGIQSRGEGRLLIVGAGGLGNWCLQLGKAMFAGKKIAITVSDISQEKLDQAKQDGADFVQVWKTESPTNFAEYMQEMGTITQAGKHKFDAAIDFVGTKDTFNFAYRALRQAGTIVNVGLYGAIADVPLPELAIKQYVIQGNFVGTKSSLKELIDFVQDKNVKYPHLEFIKLDEINETHERMKQGKIKGRALIKFDK